MNAAEDHAPMDQVNFYNAEVCEHTYTKRQYVTFTEYMAIRALLV